MKQTLYDILGVAPDASFEDIELAYNARFEALQNETSWESNRFVLLNEAHEVLSDANRRIAYDNSLAAPPRTRRRAVDIDEEPGSPVKWLIFGVLAAAIVIWWTLREDPPPVQPTAAPEVATDPVQETSQPIAEASQSAVAPQAEIAANAPEESNLPVNAPAESEVATPTPAANSPIVGTWNCFDPVNGRTSQYNFSADSTVTILRSEVEPQTFTYEFANGQVKLVDATPPRSMRVEELSKRKLILGSAEEGRTVVCAP